MNRYKYCDAITFQTRDTLITLRVHITYFHASFALNAHEQENRRDAADMMLGTLSVCGKGDHLLALEPFSLDFFVRFSFFFFISCTSPPCTVPRSAFRSSSLQTTTPHCYVHPLLLPPRLLASCELFILQDCASGSRSYNKNVCC